MAQQFFRSRSLQFRQRLIFNVFTNRNVLAPQLFRDVVPNLEERLEFSHIVNMNKGDVCDAFRIVGAALLQGGPYTFQQHKIVVVALNRKRHFLLRPRIALNHLDGFWLRLDELEV